MKPPREGTNKRAVYDCFKSKGVDEATKLGSATGVTPWLLNKWFSLWGGEPVVVKAPSPPKPAKVVHETNTEANSHGKRRVYDVAFPGYFGTVVKEGPQVSEVRWDNNHPAPHPNVLNKYLVDAPALNMKKSKRGE